MLTQPLRGEAAAFYDNASFYRGEWAYSSIQAGIVHLSRDEFMGFVHAVQQGKVLSALIR